MGKTDGNDALRLRFARSILKRVTSGNPLEIMWVTQMIAGHGATMNVARLMNSSKTVDDIERSGNIFNKLMRTFTDQMGTMHRLHSGPEPKLMVSVNDGGQAAFVNHLTQNVEKKAKPTPRRFRPLSPISPAWRCQLLSRITSPLRPCRVWTRTKSPLQARKDASDAHDRRS